MALDTNTTLPTAETVEDFLLHPLDFLPNPQHLSPSFYIEVFSYFISLFSFIFNINILFMILE
jgi:hypothetical protein